MNGLLCDGASNKCVRFHQLLLLSTFFLVFGLQIADAKTRCRWGLKADKHNTTGTSQGFSLDCSDWLPIVLRRQTWGLFSMERCAQDTPSLLSPSPQVGRLDIIFVRLRIVPAIVLI